MAFLQKIFGKKDDAIEMAWQALTVPPVVESSRQLSIGPYTLQRHLGDLQQVRPPYKAQIWQGLDADGQFCSIGIIEPGEEKQKWLKERLGSIRIKSATSYKVQGELRKIGTSLCVLAFDTIIVDRYVIRKCLISDKMQETYEAWDTKQGVSVFCTIHIPPKLASLPEKFVSRIADKPKKNKTLHPQVLEVLHEGMCRPFGMFAAHRYKYPALYYVITRYISGANFQYFVNQNRRKVTPEQIGFIFYEISSILKCFQEAGIYHGNIRPETLWIADRGEEAGHIFLNGFSLLNLTQDINTTAFSVLRNVGEYGCITCMAPEQVADPNLDAKSDNFSLGMLIYILVFGKIPFSVTDVRQALRQLTGWNPKSVSEWPSKFCWLIPTLEKLLQRSPADRSVDWAVEVQNAKDAYTSWSNRGEGIASNVDFSPDVSATEIPENTSVTEEPVESSTTKDSVSQVESVVFADVSTGVHHETSDQSQDAPKEEEPNNTVEFEEWEEMSSDSVIAKKEEKKKSFFGRLFGSWTKVKPESQETETTSDMMVLESSEAPKQLAEHSDTQQSTQEENKPDIQPNSKVSSKVDEKKQAKPDVREIDAKKNTRPEMTESDSKKISLVEPDSSKATTKPDANKAMTVGKMESAPEHKEHKRGETPKSDSTDSDAKKVSKVDTELDAKKTNKQASSETDSKKAKSESKEDTPSKGDTKPESKSVQPKEDDVEELSEQELMDLAVDAKKDSGNWEDWEEWNDGKTDVAKPSEIIKSSDKKHIIKSASSSKPKPITSNFEIVENVEIEDGPDLEPEEITAASRPKIMPATIPTKSVAELQEQLKELQPTKNTTDEKKSVTTTMPTNTTATRKNVVEENGKKSPTDSPKVMDVSQSIYTPEPSSTKSSDTDEVVFTEPIEKPSPNFDKDIEKIEETMLDNTDAATDDLPQAISMDHLITSAPTEDMGNSRILQDLAKPDIVKFNPDLEGSWETEMDVVNSQQWENEEDEEDILIADGSQKKHPPKNLDKK